MTLMWLIAIKYSNHLTALIDTILNFYNHSLLEKKGLIGVLYMNHRVLYSIRILFILWLNYRNSEYFNISTFTPIYFHWKCHTHTPRNGAPFQFFFVPSIFFSICICIVACIPTLFNKCCRLSLYCAEAINIPLILVPGHFSLT